MDENFWNFDTGPDPVEAARQAGTQIARARHEVKRRVGMFLVDAVDDEELIQRLSYPDVDAVIDEATERHLGSVSDGKAKLARSLVREVHAKWEAAEVLVITKDGGLRVAREWSEEERDEAKYKIEDKGETKFPMNTCKDVSNAYHRLHQTNAPEGKVRSLIDRANKEMGCGIESEASVHVAEKETIELRSGDVEIEKGKLTKLVGGPPSEHMDKVRELADKGNKAALFFLNVLHHGALPSGSGDSGESDSGFSTAKCTNCRHGQAAHKGGGCAMQGCDCSGFGAAKESRLDPTTAAGSGDSGEDDDRDEGTAMDRDDPNRAGKFRADVRGVGENTWTTNAMVYNTHDGAHRAVSNLYGRWFGMDKGRVVPADHPFNETVDPNDSRIVVGKVAGTWECGNCGTVNDSRSKTCEQCGDTPRDTPSLEDRRPWYEGSKTADDGGGDSGEGDEPECLDGPDGCSGKVEYRMPLSGTGRSFPRCDKHWEKRLDTQERINRDYPDSPFAPSWFDPSAAGERWDEDY